MITNPPINSLMTTKNYNVIQAEKYTFNLCLYQKNPQINSLMTTKITMLSKLRPLPLPKKKKRKEFVP